MKKLISLILALGVLSLTAGCGDDEPKDSTCAWEKVLDDYDSTHPDCD